MATRVEMATRVCPHCGVEGVFGLGTEERIFDPAAESFIHLEICRNAGCGGAVAVVTKGLPARECELFPGRENTVMDILPFEVKTAYEQARQSLRAHIYDAAVMMCLCSLDEAMQALGAKGKSLEDRIQSVTKDDSIPRALREWSQSGSLRGVLRSQSTGSGHAEAEELIQFCERFFEYAFAFPAKVNESRRALKGERGATGTAFTSPARASGTL